MEFLEKIKDEIARRRASLPWGACAAQLSMEANCKSEAYEEILQFIGKLEDQIEKNPSREEIAKQVAYDKCKGLPNGELKDTAVFCAMQAVLSGIDWIEAQYPKWLVDYDYEPSIDGRDFSLHSVGIAYRGHYIPYSELLKLPKEV